MDLYPYARQAYDAKKFAFVTDVVRLYALKTEGGVYLDSDVEVLKPLDEFLHHQAFSGFENNNSVPTGIMASVKDSAWATEMLSYYDTTDFLDENNEPILTTNVVIITNLMKEKGIVMSNKFQEIDDYVAFYPHDYFCPKDWSTGIITLTDNSYCIHHFAGSWVQDRSFIYELKMSIKKVLHNTLGPKLFDKILNNIRSK